MDASDRSLTFTIILIFAAGLALFVLALIGIDYYNRVQGADDCTAFCGARWQKARYFHSTGRCWCVGPDDQLYDPGFTPAEGKAAEQ